MSISAHRLALRGALSGALALSIATLGGCFWGGEDPGGLCPCDGTYTHIIIRLTEPGPADDLKVTLNGEDAGLWQFGPYTGDPPYSQDGYLQDVAPEAIDVEIYDGETLYAQTVLYPSYEREEGVCGDGAVIVCEQGEGVWVVGE